MKNLLLFSVIFISLAFASSCKKYTDEFVGPALGIAPDDFTATGFSVSNASPNFVSQTTFFQSTFNATVRWSIELTGQTSGAVKILTGVSNVLDASTATWDGSTDVTKLFRTGETVNASFTVLGWDQTLTTSLVIGSVKNHGFVLATFETIAPDGGGNFTDNGYYWFSNFDAPAEKTFLDKIADVTTPQGSYALKISGQDNTNINSYIGKAGLSASAPFRFNFGTTSAANLYINLYVKGGGTTANAKLVIETFEDDNADNTQMYNGTEDKLSHAIPLNFDGWKLVSVKYSDFGIESSGGNNTIEANKIHLISFYLGPILGSTATVDAVFDYPVITVNGPMIP